MRKLLIAVLCAAVAAPAVALASDHGTTTGVASAASANANFDGRGDTGDKARAGRARARFERRARTAAARARRARRHHAQAAQAAPTASPALQAIASCESGGDPHAIGGGGAYRGKYQFDRSTWAAVGGSGDPAAAPEAEQDRRAAMLYSRSGATSWPVCGQ